MYGRKIWSRGFPPRRPQGWPRPPLIAGAAFIILLSAGTAGAQVHRAVIRSYEPEGLPGYSTHDILVDFTGQYTGSQMILELASGEIYQNVHPGRPGTLADTPPASFLLTVDPTMAWDTFVANGGPTAQDTIGSIGIAGAAINIAEMHNGQGPQRPSVFSDTAIDLAWFANVGNDFIEDAEGFMVARVTLSDDANGTFRFVASANQQLGVAEVVTAGGTVIQGGGPNGVTLPVINGFFTLCPEPSTVVLLGLGVVASIVLIRRRPDVASATESGGER